MATTDRPRYQVSKDRSVWYVIDTRTGLMWPRFTQHGARQYADHLNRRNP